ncbi:MAG TPA: hypothetical protein VFG14_12815 [Chthoniobacteraceae bacterium]|nr:hypothetical protein [Chthoniobacteraceae bacterium]
MAATSLARTPRAVPRDMTRADICNVEPLSADDFEALGFEDDGLDVPGWDDAWTLTVGGEQ